jgi:hypothetical protein
VGYGWGRSYYNPNESVVNAGIIKNVKLRWQAIPTLPSEDHPFTPVKVKTAPGTTYSLGRLRPVILGLTWAIWVRAT